MTCRMDARLPTQMALPPRINSPVPTVHRQRAHVRTGHGPRRSPPLPVVLRQFPPQPPPCPHPPPPRGPECCAEVSAEDGKGFLTAARLPRPCRVTSPFLDFFSQAARVFTPRTGLPRLPAVQESHESSRRWWKNLPTNGVTAAVLTVQEAQTLLGSSGSSTDHNADAAVGGRPWGGLHGSLPRPPAHSSLGWSAAHEGGFPRRGVSARRLL